VVGEGTCCIAGRIRQTVAAGSFRAIQDRGKTGMLKMQCILYGFAGGGIRQQFEVLLPRYQSDIEAPDALRKTVTAPECPITQDGSDLFRGITDEFRCGKAFRAIDLRNDRSWGC